MQQTIAKNKREKKMIASAVALLIFTMFIVYSSGVLDDFFGGEPAAPEEEISQNELVNPPAAQKMSDEKDSNATSSSAAVPAAKSTPNAQASNSGDAALARMVTAPSYNDVYSAGEIIRRAIDQPEAEKFVAARMTLRSMRIQEELSKLQASDAENRLKKAEADKKLASLNGQVMAATANALPVNGLVPDANETVPGAVSMKKQIDREFSEASMRFPESEKSNSETISIDEEKESKRNKIRLAGFSKSGRFTFQFGSEFVPNAQVGQTVFNRFKVKSSDLKSRCVAVSDSLTKRTENVCYNG